MPNRNRSRYSASRRSPDDEHFWRSEKEPSFMHPERPRVALVESPSFDPRTCTVCSEPARDCTCCRECNKPAVASRLCEDHGELHTMQVEREQKESERQVAYLVTQLAMGGAL